MADDFQTEVCGESWWINSSRGMFGSSLCSPAIDHIGGFGWASDLLEARTRSSMDQPVVFHEVQKPQQFDSVTGTALMEMMGVAISSPAARDWEEVSIGAESNYHHPMLLEDNNSRILNYKQAGIDCSEIQQEWSPTNLSVGGQLGSPINAFKPVGEGYSLEEPCLGSVSGSGSCQGTPTSFSTSSASYSYSSTSMQTVFNTNPQSQESPFENPSVKNSPPTNSNHFSPPKLSQLCSLLKPSFPKLQPTSHLPFNKTSAAATQASFFPSAISQFQVSTFEEKPNSPNLGSKCSSSVIKKNSSEPAFKRPRIETPSPLPTFKVRKEKLGDRITVLQQLVSPFGKTDTASVLHEAIEYIKFLHDQLDVLSSPYMKNEVPITRQQTCEKLKDTKQDLRSRGLCLMPISSTYPVANETAADFWRQTFGKMS